MAVPPSEQPASGRDATAVNVAAVGCGRRARRPVRLLPDRTVYRFPSGSSKPVPDTAGIFRVPPEMPLLDLLYVRRVCI
jgi:hypothetical protein